jgi:hypothetical protein
VLDGSQHDHRKGQLARREHLDEQAANDGSATTQAHVNGQRARQQSIDNRCCGDATDYLCQEYHDTADRRDGSDEKQRQRDLKPLLTRHRSPIGYSAHSRIEHPATDTVEQPHVYSHRTPKTHSNKENPSELRRLDCRIGLDHKRPVRNLGDGESKQKEQKCACELREEGCEVALVFVGKESHHGRTVGEAEAIEQSHFRETQESKFAGEKGHNRTSTLRLCIL